MSQNYLGIDVSKSKFDVVLLVGEKSVSKEFANTPKGMKLLQGWLRSLRAGEVHACLEATGSYSDGIANFLYEAGYCVSVVNPFRTHSFRDAKLLRNKTDKVDAGMIAEFCRSERPEPWKPPSPQVIHLQALSRRIDALEEMRLMETNRLDTAPKQAKTSVKRMIRVLEKEIAALRKEAEDLIDSDPDLKQQDELLRSIPGVGKKTSMMLLSEVEFDRYDSARSVAAYAGVTPAKQDSGKQIKTRLSRVGAVRIRKGMYFPAIVAMTHNPIITEFASRLSKRGKRKMQIVCAAIRKLLHIAYGVLKHRTPFTPNPAF
ncbi:MAG: IS110 family transposase [Acidobacteria bacterium]|nr:IS110 family transposase [Acidobacteriota bacterium]MBK8810843.1 IS110 family transposase [Acidobacteriota bacterium]MBK8813599.1 IS110 family transposase [Acidobacteriota bacterium]